MAKKVQGDKDIINLYRVTFGHDTDVASIFVCASSLSDAEALAIAHRPASLPLARVEYLAGADTSTSIITA